MSTTLLLDNSAWARLGTPALSRERAEEIAEAIEQELIATCLPFLLEAGYSARGPRDHNDLMDELTALPLLRIDEEVELRAIDAQRQLARSGHHRLPPFDLMLAALADQRGVGILHYDEHYDVIAARTDLRFDSVWLAPRGTL